MRVNVATSEDLSSEGFRLDASYHASTGQQTLKQLRRSGKKLERLEDVCLPDGVFIPARFKRIFVDDSQNGAPYITGGSILQAEPMRGAKLLSYNSQTT